jgi:hypothetical protein
MATKKVVFLMLLAGFILESCADFDFTTNETDDPYTLAVPLINSKLTIQKVGDLLDSTNASLFIDNQGKVTAKYSGEVIRQNASAIFPAYPGIVPFFITAPTTTVKLPLSDAYLIKNAIFKETKIRFEFLHETTQDIKINLRILEVSKDNKVFEKDFVLKYSGQATSELKTEEISLDGWQFKSNNNTMTFVYDARLPDGTSVTLKKSIMPFDAIKFSYLDGYLGYHIFGIEGSAIDVGLFNTWQGGSFNFDDPKIFLTVENGFGIPVRSKINKMDLTSITGNTVSLQSTYINSGINFAYPDVNNVGTSKTTNFYFDKTNSNIKELFNQKTKTISYDIDALVNPDKDTLIKGYITDDSYFAINVAVELPMKGSIDSFQVLDTFDFSLGAEIPERVEKIQLDVTTENDFPANVILDAHMLDEAGNDLGSLFANKIILKPSTVDASGKTISSTFDKSSTTYDKAMIDKLVKAKKLVFRGNVNTLDSYDADGLWIYANYGIGLNVGAIIDYKAK